MQLASVQFSCSVVSDSLRPHESQHARPPCPSPSPGVHSDSRPSSQWCHPAISSSVVPLSSCPQSLPASESFPMSQRFAWGGQSTGASALASFLPKKYQGWSPSEWTGWISLQSKELSRVFSNTTLQKHHSIKRRQGRYLCFWSDHLLYPWKDYDILELGKRKSVKQALRAILGNFRVMWNGIYHSGLLFCQLAFLPQRLYLQAWQAQGVAVRAYHTLRQGISSAWKTMPS